MKFYMVSKAKIKNHYFKMKDKTESEFLFPHVSMFSSLKGALKSLEEGYETIEDALRRIYKKQDILYVYEFDIPNYLLETEDYYDPEVLGASALSSNPEEYWVLKDVSLSSKECIEYSIPSLIMMSGVQEKTKDLIPNLNKLYTYIQKNNKAVNL